MQEHRELLKTLSGQSFVFAMYLPFRGWGLCRSILLSQPQAAQGWGLLECQESTVGLDLSLPTRTAVREARLGVAARPQVAPQPLPSSRAGADEHSRGPA